MSNQNLLLRQNERLYKQLNLIARKMYEVAGYQKSPDFDFSEASNPQERLYFKMACTAWETITGVQLVLDKEDRH